MRLLHVIASMDPSNGGTSQAVRNLVPEIEKSGVHNEIICLDDPTSRYLNQDPFQIHAIGAGRTPWCYSSNLMPWFLANLHRFDVAIVHGLWLYPGHAINAAIQSLKNKQTIEKNKNHKSPRIFIMPHGMLDPYFQRASGRKLKALRNKAYWKLIERKVINNADGLLFTCEQELRLARQPFHPYRPKREINVGLGISKPPCFTPEMRKKFLNLCPEVKGSPYLLFLGRIHEKKGVDILINAYASVAKKYHGQNLLLPRLVLAGPGLETSYGQKIQRMVFQNNDLNKSVLFPGMLGGDAKWGAFYGCDAFVLPSHQENFGIAVVEAMACGKAVLISNQVNIWKEIQEGGGGIIVDDSEQETERMLDRWVNLHDEQKQIMSQKARASYEQYFAIDSASRFLLNAIRDCS